MNVDLNPILLAEDNPYDAELTLDALKENSISNPVVHVTDGTELMDYLSGTGAFEGKKTLKPILILLDIKMPKMDGIQVLEKLKNDPELKKIPVIMLTASKEEIDLYKSYEIGTNAFVVKPVEFEDFIDAVKIVGNFWCLVNEPPPLK
jgi:CheY-like chemotaxis protein